MNKKLLTLSLLPLSLALVACGGGEKTSSTEDSTPSSTDSTPTSKPIEISFWTTFGQKNGEALAKTAGDFNRLVKEHMNIDVNVNPTYIGGYGDVYNNLSKALLTNNHPTMAIAYPDHVAAYLQEEKGDAGKFVVNLEDYFDDAEVGFGKQAWLGDSKDGQVFGKDDIVDNFIDEGTHYLREGSYSYPFMKSSEALFYNLDAVELAFKGWKPEVGTSTTKVQEYMNSITWDEFIDLCAYINEHKASVLSTIKTPFYYDSDGNLFVSKMYQNDIPYAHYDESKKLGVVDFETGEARSRAEAMVKTLKAQFDAGTFKTKGTEGTYGSDSFKKGESVFTVGSTGGTGYNMPDGDGFKVGVCKVPVSNDNPLFVTQGPTICIFNNRNLSAEENALKVKLAWMFAKYITNPDVNVYQCTYGSEGYLPIRYSAYETAEFQQFIADPDDIFSKTAHLLIDEIDGRYINPSVFAGSADLRDKAGGILTKAFSTNMSSLDDAGINEAISSIFTEQIEAAKGKFR